MPVARHDVERQMPPPQLVEQHWLPVVQVPPSPTQVARVHWPTRQLSPEQQSPAVEQSSPEMWHDVALRHWFDRHVPAQQSVVAAQMPKSARHEATRQTPPEHVPEQHMSLVLHATPVPRHTGARQVPEVQVPAQQSPAVAQVSAVAWHVVDRQRPPVQALLQHCDAVVHAVPLALHAVVRQVPPAQRSPVQQAVPPVVHAAPAATQVGGVTQRPDVQVSPEQQSAGVAQVAPEAAQRAAQVPDWHARPAQQSASAAHTLPSAWHAHRPLAQSICPQHSAELAHAAFASAQHSELVGDGRHEAPAQHCEALAHVAASAVHVGALTHRPPVQARPALQREPAQHACAEAPHAVGTSGGDTTSRGANSASV